MFLNKKVLTKIWLLTGAYLTLAACCFVSTVVFTCLDMECGTLIVLGILSVILAPLFYKLGRYAEGKGKLLSKGNKLICHELRPAEYIRLYEERRDDPTNVISKPDYDVLQMLVAAYDALEDRTHALETMDQALAVVPEKHRNRAMILKCGLLFNYGKFDEAEVTYRDLTTKDLDMVSKTLMDTVMKSDRAIALGDDATAEAYFRQSLTQTFPKPTPLSVLYAHYHLAKICQRTNRAEEALEHLHYCIQNGGQTGTQREAEALMKTH